MRKIQSKLLSSILLCFLMICGSSAAEIVIYAAASLMDAVKEIRTNYRKESPDKIVFNFDSSSNLARQILEGAPADLFISADEDKMDLLQKKGFILKGTRKSFLSNRLVIVAHQNNALIVQSPNMLADSGIKRIALAEPQTVPAGIYAQKYLTAIGIWSKVKERVIPTENARATLAAVESGNADVGIVYKTDAAISKKVRILFEVPSEQGPKISYAQAVLKDSKNADSAKELADYMLSEEAIKIFQKYGFLILRP